MSICQQSVNSARYYLFIIVFIAHVYKDITYNGDHAEFSHIVGYDEERMVKNIRFENLKINGKVISDDMTGKPAWYKTSDMARFFVGEHVGDIVFVK